jgi:hypothetical protein
VIVEVLDHAEQDLRAGIRFYQRRERWLGEYFLDTLCAEVESLALLAGIHHRTGRYYRSLSKRFPFAIYYTMTDDRVKVWAVLDCRRDPAWIKQQLRKRK